MRLSSLSGSLFRSLAKQTRLAANVRTCITITLLLLAATASLIAVSAHISSYRLTSRNTESGRRSGIQTPSVKPAIVDALSRKSNLFSKSAVNLFEPPPPSPFTPGDVVVYRVGDGSATLPSTSTVVFLDEYTPAGTLVQSIPMPTTVNGANKRLTASGTATSEGQLTRSIDGQYLTAAGYDAATGATVTSSLSATVNRVIARVDANGNVDTTTALNDAASGSNPRGVVSTDGTNMWITGGAGGIRYTTVGSTTSVQLNAAVTNLRQTNVFNNQLYVSSASGTTRLATVGSGIPTTSGQLITQLPGIPTTLSSPYGFFFAKLNPGGTGPDTVYIADDSTSAGGLFKFSLVGGTWAANGSAVGTSLGVRSITGTVQGSTATLYVTSSSGLLKITDTSGYNAPINGALAQIASAGTNKAFRGVAFAPTSTNPSTNPTGDGSANPSTVAAGGQTLLTVTVTPGANPTSTGLGVTANLSAIGGNALQTFVDDGTNGDLVAGDGIFSYLATVSLTATGGNKSLPVTITDAQSRTGNTSISLSVLAATPPTGIGSANPSTVQVGSSTLLTVSVTPGSNPVSTGLSVTGDLSSIGGSGVAQFFDDGTHGDVTPNDNIFSLSATVAAGTSSGAKSLPITISDAQARSNSTTISVTIPSPPPPTTIKISQVYGGGGNSGSTYTNDFVELFNSGSTPIDITGWSIQNTASNGTSWTLNGPPTVLSGVIQPGHYYLIQESQGNGGTTSLPAADVVGSIALSATNSKVALVANSTVLTGSCPLGGAVVDFVGYGSANCFETAPVGPLSNTTAAIRKGNGCLDTDNNSNDFVINGPIPRNSSSPVNSCGGDPTQPLGLGIASPQSLEPASNTLLTVRVTPASTPPSTSITVTADLTSIGGPSSVAFVDDGTNGDQTAGDNVFSVTATIGPFISTGAKSIVATITDGQGRVATAPITLTIQSPTCGVERWSVKVGADPDSTLVNLNNAVPTTITDLSSLTPPADPPGPPDNARIAPTETTMYVINATMTLYKKETDVDYHIVIQDDNGHTMIAEIPSPACIITTPPSGQRLPAQSPFATAIANARAKFDARLTALPNFQTANIPVRITGVGFFDFIHGQTGVAPNGIELHPVLDISFLNSTTTALASSANPSQFAQSVSFTTTVTTAASGTPTGNVTFFDGSNSIGIVPLDQNGQAVFTTDSLTVGSHTITASYQGDNASATSTSTAVIQVVNKADQSISFDQPPDKTFGDADFALTAAASSGLSVSFQVDSGPATISGNIVHITGAGTIAVRASQAGDDSYNAAADVTRTFTVGKASAVITVNGFTGGYDGQPHGATGSAIGVFGEDLSNLLNLGSSFTNVPGGTATWAFAGNNNYQSATGSVSIVINKADQTITFSQPPDKTFGDADFTLTASASSGFAVSFQLISGPATLFGNSVHITGAGTLTIQASQAGDGNYNPAPDVVRSLLVSKTSAVITVNGFSGVYDGHPHGATGTAVGINSEDLSGLLNLGASFTNVPGGTAVWSFAGNANYQSATGTVSIAISKATPTLVWNNPADITYGTPLGAGQLNAIASVPGGFIYAPAAGVILNAGSGQTLSTTFTPTDTTNYNGVSANVLINVLRANPSFSNLSSPVIPIGTPMTTLAGKISFGSLIPTGSVQITVNGVTQPAAIQAAGNFSSNFATAGLAPISPPYTITYNYGGDINFNAASGGGALTVGYNVMALYDQTKAANSGSTIPIKLEITDANGNNISSSNTVLTAVGVGLASSTSYGPADHAGNSNPNNVFRFDAGTYIFNLKTAGLSSGLYNLYFTIGTDPTLHAVQFQIR